MALPASIFGINIPSLPFGAPYCALSDGGSVPSISPLALVSPAGTFLAAIAALVSVYMIVIDELQVGIASPILPRRWPEDLERPCVILPASS